MSFVIPVLLGVFVATDSPLEECSHGARTSGGCVSITTEVTDQQVTLGAGVTIPGTESGSTQASDPRPLAPLTPGASWSPPPPRAPVLGSSQCVNIVSGSCRGSSPAKNPVQAEVVAPLASPTPPTSLSDLASFSPGGSSLVVEPGWWSLPRVPTNIYTQASVQTQPGQLLGWPIEVRFTPKAFNWSYGDGTQRLTLSPGGSWGGAQFTSTATSHTYRAPGNYSVSLSVEYAVSYRFPGEAFIAIPGTITQNQGSTSIQVLRVSPVLTEAGCAPASLVDGRCR
jgi:hypothetical protein